MKIITKGLKSPIKKCSNRGEQKAGKRTLNKLLRLCHHRISVKNRGKGGYWYRPTPPHSPMACSIADNGNFHPWDNQRPCFQECHKEVGTDTHNAEKQHSHPWNGHFIQLHEHRGSWSPGFSTYIPATDTRAATATSKSSLGHTTVPALSVPKL